MQLTQVQLLEAASRNRHRNVGAHYTRALQIVRSPLGDQAGLHGADFMVIDELLTADRFSAWIGVGSPAGRPELASRAEPRGA